MFNFNTDLADISDKFSVSAVKVTNKNGENLLKKKIR